MIATVRRQARRAARTTSAAMPTPTKAHGHHGAGSTHASSPCTRSGAPVGFHGDGPVRRFECAVELIACARWSCQATRVPSSMRCHSGSASASYRSGYSAGGSSVRFRNTAGERAFSNTPSAPDPQIRLAFVAEHDHVGVGRVGELQPGRPSSTTSTSTPATAGVDGKHTHPHVRRFAAADAVCARGLGVCDDDGWSRDHHGRREQRAGATHDSIVAPRSAAGRIRSQSRRRARGRGRAGPWPPP